MPPFLTPQANFQGCDTDALWQFVPYFRTPDDLRTLRLDNPALTLKVANPSILNVDVQTPKWGGNFRTVVLKGLAEGTTTIDVILPSQGGPAGILLQTWTIEVGFEIEIPVQYHFVKGLTKGTEQTSSTASIIFAEANDILRSQANVSLLPVDGGTMRRLGYGKPVLSAVDKDTDKEKRTSDHQMAWLLYDVLKYPQYFHVFFVRDIILGSSQTGQINGFYDPAIITRGVMVIKDRPGVPLTALGRTVAHEFAHARKLNHAATAHSRRDILMWGKESPASTNPGDFLSRAEIESLRKL
ncbi:hypothetical protein F183_A01550 [Bryobacterales bacterium F-183]|nr:hypothetical protein F183_A01550 [Bryobacterales bacterium F-183]